MKKYATAVGGLLWAANRTQASLADLFSALVDLTDLNAGTAVWLSIRTDNGQVAALKALLKVRAAPRSRLYRNIQWAISAVGKLAEIRNDAAHMSTSPTMTNNGLALTLNPIDNTTTRLQRRNGTDFVKLFALAKGDYIQVERYVHDIFCHLAYPNDHYPLPLRPKLSSVVVQSQRKTRPTPSSN